MKEHIEDEQKSARELVLKKRLERKEQKKKTKNPPTKPELLHCDVIKEEFWMKYPQILEE